MYGAGQLAEVFAPRSQYGTLFKTMLPNQIITSAFACQLPSQTNHAHDITSSLNIPYF